MMKRALISILFLLIVSAGLTEGQIPGDDVGERLSVLFKSLRSATTDDDRLGINDSIKSCIEQYIASGKVFGTSIPDVRYLGQIASSDSLIKILTWNLALTGEPGRYYCYFIKRSSKSMPGKVYSLMHKYEDKEIATDTVYNQSDWYGALYYDIRPFRSQGKQCWALLGINYPDPLLTRKVIDVLSFDGENNLIFGMKCFVSGSSVKYRHVLQYSSDAAVSLRFISDKSIVFDHLAPLPPTGIDNRIFYGPDYSFDAYNLKNGLWIFSLNVDVRNKKK